jgi:hypothetical protein
MNGLYHIVVEVYAELKRTCSTNPRFKRIAIALALFCLLSFGYAAFRPRSSLVVRRYPLSGIVTFNGQPVPRGTISFVASAAGREYAGYAGIVDGKFDTRTDGRGHVGGEHVITVMGFQAPSDANSEEAKPVPLFQPIQLNDDFRYGSTFKKIDLPLRPKQ